MNYQIYPYYINKITNYEKVNYSSPPYLILKNPNKVENNHSLLLSSPLLSSPSKLPNTALERREYQLYILEINNFLASNIDNT